MHILENRNYKIELAEDASLLRITGVANGMSFESKSPFQLVYGGFYRYDIPPHARMQISATGNCITVRFDEFSFWARFKEHYYVKPEQGPDLRFTFQIVLEDDEVVFRTEPVENMDGEICTVTFPACLFGWHTDRANDLVLPMGYGSIFRFPYDGVCEFPWSSLLLPVYGVFGGEGGFGVYLRDSCDQSGYLNVNLRKKGWAFCENRWEFERETANYRREMRVKFFRKGESYVQLAKWYRGIVMREGRFVSLKEKIAMNPEVEKLVGSVIWKHNTYSTPEVPDGVMKDYSLYVASPEAAVVEGKPANWSAYEVFDTAKKQGFDRVCIYSTGWNFMGFDSGYPTRLPPNPERGSAEGFSRAAEYGRSLSEGYIYSVHDNYRDCYPNSPEYDQEEMIHNRSMAAQKGGIWRGGRCWLMCGANALKYAERDLPRIAGMTGRGSIYLDVLGLVQPFACWHSEHPQTQSGDLEFRRKILNLARRCFGSVATEGAPADFCADLVDVGAFYFFTQKIHPGFIVPLPVPLWQLVYHDSVLGYTGEGLCGYSGGDYLAMTALYGMLPTQFDETSRKMSLELRSVYRAEMLSHEFLRERSDAARAVFSDGTEVIANTGDTEICYGEIRIAPHSFKYRKNNVNQ